MLKFLTSHLPPFPSLAWVLAAWLVLYVIHPSPAPLFDIDEGAFSEASRYMLASGDWLSTWLNGAPRFDKPILIYWLQALSAAAFGINEFAFRLPSVLATLGWALAVRELGKVILNTEAGDTAAILLLSSLAVLTIGQAATADALLNMWLALSGLELAKLYIFSNRKPYWLATWIGLGLLTKGPIALLIPALAAIGLFAPRAQWPRFVSLITNLWAWALLLVIAMPWYIAQYHRFGQAFIDAFFLHHNLDRFMGSLEGHSGAWFYYPLLTLVLIAPATAWITVIFKYRAAIWNKPLHRFLLCWFLLVLLFFSFSQTKLPHYLNYALTPLLMLLALWRDRLQARWPHILVIATLITLFIGLPWLIQLAADNQKNPIYQTLTKSAFEQFSSTNQLLITALGSLAIWAIIRHFSLWRGSLIAGLCLAGSISHLVLPPMALLLQQPIRAAGQFVYQRQHRCVMWNVNYPSFSVYRQGSTARRMPIPGEWAFTHRSRWQEGQGRIVFSDHDFLVVEMP